MRTETSRPVRLEDYRPPDWLIDTVDLDVALHPTATRVRATLSLRPNPNGRADAPLALDGEELNLVSLSLDNVPLTPEHYDATASGLTIAAPPRRPFRLSIETLVDPSANSQLSGLYRSGASYCTQCEAEGFRRITYFLDRPDVMAVYTTRIEARKSEAPILLANGNPVASGEVAGTDRHFAVWHDPFPKPCYLFALVGGRLACVEDSFRTLSGRNVALKIFVEPGKEGRCAYAMDSLKRAMRWDEVRYGREYDLDVFMIVAVSDFNMGAMENKGLNVFNDRYVLATQQTATDADFANIEAVIAHEYFHNWTGNRITCRDWFQLCLKEGLTVFRDQEFSAEQRSRAVERIGDVRVLRAQQFVEDAGPLAHPVRPSLYHEINNFYTATVYEKGAEIVRMLKVLLGEDGFRKGMDLYFDRHDGHAATVEDFVACFADANATDLTQFLRWYAQAGTPELRVIGSFDAAARSFRLDVAQALPPRPGQPAGEPMVIPLVLGLVGRDGRDLPLATADGRRIEGGVLTVSRPTQSFEFVDVPERPVLSLNRGFSAPIKVFVETSAADLQFLAAHDCDPFNRWEALQRLATSLLVEGVEELRAGGTPPADRELIEALAATLADRELEPAFLAQALSMPAEADIARELGEDIDPDAIFRARSELRKSIGQTLGPILEQRYARMTDAGPYSPDARSAGRRALKNACLDLLVMSGKPEAIAMAERQYERADNMTDRMGALSALALHDVPARARCLEHFYRTYEADPLVVDKWFALQAAIPEPATLARVRSLTAHPAFSFANPNRIRALIGAFAQMNQTQFNRADGAGYEFVAQTVVDLDPKNPQVAARLLAAFKSWRALEPARRAKAEASLRRVAAIATLSPDVKDIVTRMTQDAGRTAAETASG
jgi:aminopeptidase N